MLCAVDSHFQDDQLVCARRQHHDIDQDGVSHLRAAFQILTVGLFCLAIAAGAVVWIVGPPSLKSAPGATQAAEPAAPAQEDNGAYKEVFPDPNAAGTSARVYAERGDFDDTIALTAFSYTGAVRDPNSLEELREALKGRGRRGIADLRFQFEQLKLDSAPTLQQAVKAIPLVRSIAFLYMYEGKFAEANEWLHQGLALSQRSEISPEIQANFHILLGVAALRRGEVENCIDCSGPSSCIYPLDLEAMHRQQLGSRDAIKEITAYLQSAPGDLRARWLLNIAYMTLGEHPDQVPKAFVISRDAFHSTRDVGKFENVASKVGLGARGPNMAGGSIFDDFTGDGLPDLLTATVDADLGASLFVNRGDGTFEDRSSSAGLLSQIYVLNLAQGDFDNDGNSDVVMLRGAWQDRARLSLLRNKGGGVFEDVTIASGLGEPLSTESAVWGDYDQDGRLDLFVCGEYHRDKSDHVDLSRLYHNEGNGTFKNVAESAGIVIEQICKGSAWGDYDGDGRLDLFVSVYDGDCRMYHNEGNGKFKDVAKELGLVGPSHRHCFACWFWDFDNDGRLDLFVNDYYAVGSDVVAYHLGLKEKDAGHPHLYRNLGEKRFADVSLEAGLEAPITAMGANFGDIDNDGFLDAYFGTGGMAYAGLIPNVMLKNIDGRRLEDVTESSRTGHLQKGHGVSFADWDCDGDLDIFCVLGGAYPGDQSYNALFQNPGHGRQWLKVKLIGTRSNRPAIGARIQAEFSEKGGAARSVYRTVGNNGSFGGSTWVQMIGLGDARTVLRLTVTWPGGQSKQTFENIPAGQSIEITEGSDSYKTLKQPPLVAKPPNG
jgi:hypothetical protein